ncbi:hypothetical protein ACTXG7_24850 [Mycolicibacterium sp. Dal123E01]|uniref:hypothetical protein n=1 Tax=Mycolicibacterium sp. Dal123E01 TaxID=3457578 RepID=UPI00403ED6A9
MAKKKKPVKNKATTSNKPPVPDYYLTEQPAQPGRANIQIEYEDGKASARASVPATHLDGLTALTIGGVAGAAPVAAIAITCSAELPVWAIIACTAMVSVVSVMALLALMYMLRKRGPSP